ncbi:ParB N-terminal domain-containing protein [Novipirellula rosea]|uniref:ParB-like N-terminal domain-containing protein n=1 Tax=Novipirellula rosea TaxID=1031540 RepID=A0ABP8M923_9BACT
MHATKTGQLPNNEKSPDRASNPTEANEDSQGSGNQNSVSSVIGQVFGDNESAIDVAVEAIVVDAALQARVQLDESTVAEYASVASQAIQDGKSWPFPPLVCVGNLLVDGFHRLAAAKRIGIRCIPALIRQGNHEDAIRFAVAANSQHGLRRSRADVQRAIQLAWGAWPDLSAREIARRVQCSPQTVINLRNRSKAGNPVSNLDTHEDSFIEDILSLEENQGWLQFDDGHSDSTLIARVEHGYRVYRVVGNEVVKVRVTDAQGVMDALDQTDGEYDAMAMAAPYRFIDDTARVLEAIEQAWLGASNPILA